MTPDDRLDLAAALCLAGLLAGGRGDLPLHVLTGEAIAAAAELLRRLDTRTTDPLVPTENDR